MPAPDLNSPEAQAEFQRQQEAAAAQAQWNKDHTYAPRTTGTTGSTIVNGVGDFGEAVGNALSDTFSAETVSGPTGGSWGQSGTAAAGYNAGAAARGQQIAGDARNAANRQQVDAWTAANRDAPQTGYNDKYNFLADNQRGEVGQFTRAAGDSSQQDRQLEALNNFANGPEGPSAAQAQLAAGSDAAQRSAMSMARSGRGAGDSASALRDAAFNNATTQGTVAGQSAQLRAQETDAFKQRQLAALNAAMGGAGAIRGADTAAAQVAQGTRAQDLQAQGVQDQRSQFGTTSQLQQTQLNDQARQGLLNTGLGYEQMGLQGELGYGQLGQNALNSQADYELEQQKMGLDAAKANQSADLEKDGGIGGMLSSAAGAVFSLSDERLKKDIKAEQALSRALGHHRNGSDWVGNAPDRVDRLKKNTAAARALSRALGKGGGELDTLGNAPAYSYKYKDPTMPGTRPGTQRSSMAQDLERGPHGDRVVKNTPQGKMVNYDEVMKLTPGALTELNQRLQALEKSLGKRM
jgi:hypothetical protein